MTPVGAARPRLGSTLGIEVEHMPANAGFLLQGFSNSASVLGPLPLNLGFAGMPGCAANVSPDFPQFLFGTGGTATFTTNYPADPALAGIAYFMQTLVLDPAANALGAVMSDALAVVTGIY